jgi:hypothetical protein
LVDAHVERIAVRGPAELDGGLASRGAVFRTPATTGWWPGG